MKIKGKVLDIFYQGIMKDYQVQYVFRVEIDNQFRLIHGEYLK